MKNISDFIYEELNVSQNEIEVNEGKITDEKSFKEYAEKKFKEVFGDKLDEEKMNNIVDGIIKKCDGDWGQAVGTLNKSF